MSHLRATLRLTRRRLGWAILYAIAAVYFTVDLAFLSFIRPLRRRLLGGGRIHGWIDGLNRYAALSLVLVPLAILEPVKPLGFYLTAKGHLVTGGSLIAMGEIVKVTLVEQVIEITKPKLLSFHWFAWMYSHWEAVLDRLRSIRAWQSIKWQVQSTRCSGAADEGGYGRAIISLSVQTGLARRTPPVNRSSTASSLPCRSVADTGALRSIVKPEKCSPSCFGVRQHPVIAAHEGFGQGLIGDPEGGSR